MKSRVVVAAIIEKNGKILFGEKAKDVGPYPNTWHLPGGGVDLENETLTDAVKREVKEETGLEVVNIEKASFDEDYEPNKHGELTHYLFLVFWVTPTHTNALAADDLVKLTWVKKSEIGKLPLSNPTMKCFKEVGLL